MPDGTPTVDISRLSEPPPNAPAEVAPVAQVAPKVELPISSANVALPTMQTQEQVAKDGGSVGAEDATKPAEGVADKIEGVRPEDAEPVEIQAQAAVVEALQKASPELMAACGQEMIAMFVGDDVLRASERIRARGLASGNMEQLRFGFDVPIHHLEARIIDLRRDIDIYTLRGQGAEVTKVKQQIDRLIGQRAQLETERDASLAASVPDQAVAMAVAFGFDPESAVQNPMGLVGDALVAAESDREARSALVEGLRSSNRDFADTVEDFYNNLDLRKHREHFLQDLKGKGLLALLAVLFMAWTASKTVGGGGQQGGH
jgi:NACalpha-BTF3-like transcription factor